VEHSEHSFAELTTAAGISDAAIEQFGQHGLGSGPRTIA
jgi:hypothetical protein